MDLLWVGHEDMNSMGPVEGPSLQVNELTVLCSVRIYFIYTNKNRLKSTDIGGHSRPSLNKPPRCFRPAGSLSIRTKCVGKHQSFNITYSNKLILLQI
jgi:hypothetical protein